MPRKSPRKSPRKKSPRKGRVVKMNAIDASVKAKVLELSDTHGKHTELRTYTNGTVGAFFKNGQFRFVRGATNMSGIKRSPRKVKYSNKAAKGLFTKFYKKKYPDAKKRKIAMKRDHCTKNKSVVSDTRWNRNAQRHDLAGFDDGSNCDGDVRIPRRPPSSQIDPALKSRGRARKQNGGNTAKPVSLKTAVGLLRQYYAEKYN